jgi:hypothetical protein
MRQLKAAKCRYGSIASFSTPSDHVGSYPNNDQTGDAPQRSKRANSDKSARGEAALFEHVVDAQQGPSKFGWRVCARHP